MHGVMFHHFHSEPEAARPGSFSAEDFSRALDFLERDFQIVSPEVFFWGISRKQHTQNQVMLTFDDALRSQFEVAHPIMSERGLEAGFAVYSSIYTGSPDPLEIFASFRQECFANFNGFWDAFAAQLEEVSLWNSTAAESGVASGFLEDFPFYSHEEKLFRFVRDEMLSVQEYQSVMWSMIDSHSVFDAKATADRLWMGIEQLRTLVSEGHMVGLHSHTHPTRMDVLSKKEQYFEYHTNYDWIRDNLGAEPHFVAHPCGRYSEETLQVLGDLEINYGFCSTIGDGKFSSNLKIPRVDSTYLLMDR